MNLQILHRCDVYAGLISSKTLLKGLKKSVLEIIKKGAKGYIVKPFDKEVIRKKLETLTDRMKFKDTEEIVDDEVIEL